MGGKKRQGQSGANTAAIIIVVMAFILIYILLIPSENRKELLEESDDAVLGERPSEYGVLLDESPGTLASLQEREFEHRIPSFNILTEREDVVLKSVDSVFVDSGGVASRAVAVFADASASNGRLAFQVSDHKGFLAVDFNGQEIFKGDISGVLQPLALDNIGKENIIQFYVDQPPSWKFWERNFYDIRDVRVTGTVERTDRQEAINTFFMSSEEADPSNIDDAYIIYLADCRATDVGKLSVYLNGNVLSSKVPDCGSLEKTSISPESFVSGRNELRFVAEQGRYLIDQVFVKTQLKEPIYPVYFFDLNESLFRKIGQDRINASVRLSFINDGERKNAVIDVNNRQVSVDTRQGNYSRNIDQFVVEGSNFIRVEPTDTLNLISLKVTLDCKTKKDCT